jgi:hypothetical protein
MDLNDNEKEYTPITITQAIMNIYKARRTVKESTIVNCWRKAVILISNSDYIVKLNSLELDMNIKKKFNALKKR